MALQEMAYPIRFAGGLEDEVRPQGGPDGASADARERRVHARGVAVKRYGYTSLGLSVLGSATPYAPPRGLAARGDDLFVLFTEAAAYSYVEGAGRGRRSPTG